MHDVKYYEELALKEAQKSPCQKRKVGAIIVSKDGDIIGTGHNSFGTQTNKPCEDVLGLTHPDVIHAEIMAINDVESYSPGSLKDATIYVTHQPCENCADAIVAAGLKLHVVQSFMKFDTDKLRYDLIPPEAMKALAEVLTYGAKKYKPGNWKNAPDLDRYTAALYRHLEAWRSGEEFDEESGLPHLAHALTNVAFLVYFEDPIK